MNFDLGYINQITCVTVDLKAELPVFHYIQMKFKKKEISFGKTETDIKEIEVLSKKISNRFPILLHFTGKGILNRKLNFEENYRHAILLNARIDDFYFTDYFESKLVYCSVIRKDLVESFNTQFAKLKHNVIAISSGPFHAMPLVKYLSQPDYVIDEIEVKTLQNTVSTFSKIENAKFFTKIGDDKIDAKIFGSVALGANFFSPSESVKLCVDEPTFLVNLAEAKQKNIFLRFGMGMMFFFLFILTINYFLLEQLNNKIEDNYQELVNHEDQLAMIGTLEEEYKRKENLLRSSGLLGNKFLSFYLSEIGNSVPEEISFESIEVRPTVKEIKKKQKIDFQDKIIMINGLAASSDILSNWIEDLKTYEWILKVDIITYNLIKNQGSFKIQIETK